MMSNGSRPEPAQAPRARWRTIGRPLLVAAGLWGCGLSALQAESDRSSAIGFFTDGNGGSPPPGRSQPSPAVPAVRAPAVVHHTAQTFRRVLMERATASSRSRAGAPASATAGPTTVAVYGDRLAQALAGGLEEESRNAIAVRTFTSEDAGLTGPGFDAWLKSVREGLAKADHASVAVVMIGSNDRQSISVNGSTLEPDTQAWQDLYGKRVDAVVTAFRDAHVPLIWVGLPTAYSDETSAEFVRLNGIFRDHAARDGTSFVDTWAAFSDDAGRYSPVGPDVEGQSVKLRKADGLGFTRAGSRKLASFVEADIKRLYRPSARPEASETASITIEKGRDFDQALDIDVNAQIRREAGLSPDTAPAAADPAKPAAGPVIPLTSAPLSPDGHLVSTADALPGTANAMQANLVVKPFAGGAPVTPQRGRADDFSWPRP